MKNGEVQEGGSPLNRSAFGLGTIVRAELVLIFMCICVNFITFQTHWGNAAWQPRGVCAILICHNLNSRLLAANKLKLLLAQRQRQQHTATMSLTHTHEHTHISYVFSPFSFPPLHPLAAAHIS